MGDSGTKFTYRITAEGVDAVKHAFRDLAGEIATAAGIGGIGFMIENSLKMGSNIEKMSREAGMSTRAFQEWSFVLQKYGIDQAKASEEMTKFNIAAAQFVTENAGPGKTAFERLGFTQKDVQEGLRHFDEFYGEVLSRIGQLKNEAEKLDLLRAIGGKGADDLIGPANAGIERMRAFRDEAERVGAVMTDEVIKKADDAENRMQEFAKILHMQVAVAIDENADKLEHLAQVGIDVLPHLISLVDDWATAFERAAQAIEEIANGDLEGALSRLSNDMTGAYGNYGLWGGGTIGGSMGRPYLDDGMDKIPPGAIQAMLAKQSGTHELDFYDLMGLKAPAPAGGAPKIGDKAAAERTKQEAEAYAKLVRNLNDEIEATGKSERAIFIATQTRKLSINATQEQKDAIVQLAGTLYDEQKQMQAYHEAVDRLADGVGRAFEDMAMSGKNFGDTLREIGKEVLNFAYKLMVLEPLEKSIRDAFDGGSGGFGGIFSSLFSGGGSPVDTSAGQSVNVPGVGPILSYAVGTDYVPYDMVAQIHKGERILTAEENRGFGAGGSKVTVHNYAGVGVDTRVNGDQIEIRLTRVEQGLSSLNSSIEQRAVYANQQSRMRSINN